MLTSAAHFTFLFLPPIDDCRHEWMEVCRSRVPEANIVQAEDIETAKVLLPDADAACGFLPPDLFPLAKKLRWLQAPAANPKHRGFYYPDLIESSIVVTNLRGVQADHVGIHAVAMMLSVARRLNVYMRQQNAGQWLNFADPGQIIYPPEARVLIVGMGAIGKQVGTLAQSLGFVVEGIDRMATPKNVIPTYAIDDIHERLPHATFVVLTVPHTPETEGLADAKFFESMAPYGHLVNVGRGKVVDTDALVAALRNGDIAGAALDVVDEEPLPNGHPLFSMHNVVITPHVASIGPHTNGRKAELIAENARRFASGQQLINRVNKPLWH